MTVYIIATIVGTIQVIISINLIVRKKNGWAIATELISSLILLYFLNGYSTEAQNNSWIYVSIALIEYVFVKVFLVMFMLIARYYSFYRIRALCWKEKKISTKKFRFVRAINKCDYWPRLKLGLPGRANKISKKTKVRFDSKGFPKFKVYYTVKLKRKYFRESRQRHFYMANKILYEDYNAVKKLKLSKSQIKELKQYETPSGYTWHHHQDAGVLQLVDELIHEKTWHYGGYTIWGGK